VTTPLCLIQPIPHLCCARMGHHVFLARTLGRDCSAASLWRELVLTGGLIALRQLCAASFLGPGGLLRWKTDWLVQPPIEILRSLPELPPGWRVGCVASKLGAGFLVLLFISSSSEFWGCRAGAAPYAQILSLREEDTFKAAENMVLARAGDPQTLLPNFMSI